MTRFARCTLVCAILLGGVVPTGLQGCGGSSKAGGEGGSLTGLDGALPVHSGGILGAGGVSGGGIDGGVLGGSGGSTVPVCGRPGTQCCDGNGCEQGGCCVAGICMAAGGLCVGFGEGICSAGACGSCGGAGLPCCGANPASGVCTAPGTACSAGSCTRCGDLGQPCCASASGGAGVCNGQDAICSGGACRVCGMPQTPCCPGDRCTGAACCYENACVGEAAACGASGGLCQAGRCSGCGNASQPCCGDRCYDGLICGSGMCTPCGGMGQPCCPASAATTACQAGSVCTGSGPEGLCARCGSPGDICCDGNVCAQGCCSGGRCLAVGSCPGSQDGGQADVPIGGAGGASGTGGVGGAGGSTIPSGTGGALLPPWTPPPGCGDGTVVLPERCDDGNTLPFDGCSPDCQDEPVCSGSGPCTSRCGDGLLLGEECDDGNIADSDGCSSACKVESGWVCAQPALGSRILVPAIYRDFRFLKPTDFEAGITGMAKASTGMVSPLLDDEGKPVYTGLTGTGIHVASQATFATWYRNTPDVNHATAGMLALWDNGAGAYVNRYGENGERWPITEKAFFCGSSGLEALDDLGNPIPCTYAPGGSHYDTDCDKAVAKGHKVLACALSGGTYTATIQTGESDGTPVFFPVDGDTYTPSSEFMAAQIPPLYTGGTEAWPFDTDADGKNRKHNFSFTSEIRYWFKYEADKTYKLDIAGDDDVWVFVNKRLAVDLGGIHTPVEGSVTLDAATATTFGLAPGNVYEVAVFQAERQSTSSTFKLTLSGFNLSPSQCYRN